MDSHGDELKSTLGLIANLNLAHPFGLLLTSFIKDAVDPLEAARYANERLQSGDSDSFLADWIFIVESVTRNGSPPPTPDAPKQRNITKRDGSRCCVTGRAGNMWDPLIVAPILFIPSGWDTHKPHIFDMLGIFLGDNVRDWWLSRIKRPKSLHSERSHWLIRKSAAKAFQNGLVSLERMGPSEIQYEIQEPIVGPEEPIQVDGSFPVLGDHSRSGSITVEPNCITTHAMLCKSIRFLYIAEGFKLMPSTTTPIQPSEERQRYTLSGLLSSASSATSILLFTVWRWVPSSLRGVTYSLLRRLGRSLYSSPHLSAQRLPFGFYLKSSGIPSMQRNEFNALHMIRQHTCIPTPIPLDVVVMPEDTDDTFDDSSDEPASWLLTTRVPGIPLWRCIYFLSDSNLAEITEQLKDYITQLRAIPKIINPEMAISNTLGEACQDHRLHMREPLGPFVNEEAFNQVVAFSDDPSRRGHQIFFTHADINPRNILVAQMDQPDGSKRWRISGLIDWETAGYYPEYWEYSKSMFEQFRWPDRYNNMIIDVFKEFGDYSRELETEMNSWGSWDT